MFSLENRWWSKSDRPRQGIDAPVVLSQLARMFPIRDHNPSGRTPYVTYTLMAANILIFLGYVPLFESPRALFDFWQVWAFVPAELSSGRGAYTLVTSQFLHGGWMHLAGNMLFLFIFGDNIEDELGHIRYLGFYLLCGICAALAQYIAGPMSQVPLVGASGAIAGVMGGYLLLFPKARVDILIIFIIFFRIFPIPAWIMLCLWFAMQFLGGLGSSGDEGGVAYWAHAGGFVVGALLLLPHWLNRGGAGFWAQNAGQPPHPEARYTRSRIPKVKR